MKFVRDKAHCKHEGYTKEQTDELLGAKANSEDVYTKSEVNNKTRVNVTTGGNAVKCGYQVDGKDVYVKRVNFGALPNATSKAVDSGVDR